jgi:hypothetical protein
MYRIIDDRATGKTSRLMLLAKENDGIIVCKEPIIMREKAYRYGITGIEFMSYRDFIHKHPTQPVYIDEIDLFLRSLNDYIDGYTISNED